MRHRRIVLTLSFCFALVMIAGAHPRYNRTEWRHWIDEDGDCQDTRQEVLIRDAEPQSISLSEDGCRVVRGEWIDPYSGITLTDPADVQIDHVLALREAHDAGGWAWARSKKRAYANDLSARFHLRAVIGQLNQEKSAKGEADWLPPRYLARCEYVRDRLAIRARWSLRIMPRDRPIIERVLAGC